jgi:peptidoglycan/LPS O-acetylase OafA/YrhL
LKSVSDGEPGRGRPRIPALDLFRVLVVAFVVSVHTLSMGTKTTTLTGAFITVFHTSRELFFLLTAFVLVYNYGRRANIRWLGFWRRRYALVVPAYLAWTLIYFLSDGRQLDPVSAAVADFWHDVLTGDARYQLYFLLVTMQLYLAFPLLRWLLRKTDGHHLALFLTACGYQLALTFASQHHLVTTGTIGAWLRNPDPWLPSYLLYVLAGALAAWHADRLIAFTRRHAALAGPVFAAGVCAGVGSYLAAVTLGGQSPGAASAVFQPVVVAETLCFGWALFAAALAWDERGARHRRLISAGADSSFGIYLAHPLVLQGALLLGGTTGVLAALHGIPDVLQLAAILGVGVPLIYGVSWALITFVRRTPLSLMLTGRRADRRPRTAVTSGGPRPAAAADPAPPPDSRHPQPHQPGAIHA